MAIKFCVHRLVNRLPYRLRAQSSELRTPGNHLLSRTTPTVLDRVQLRMAGRLSNIPEQGRTVFTHSRSLVCYIGSTLVMYAQQ